MKRLLFTLLSLSLLATGVWGQTVTPGPFNGGTVTGTISANSSDCTANNPLVSFNVNYSDFSCYPTGLLYYDGNHAFNSLELRTQWIQGQPAIGFQGADPYYTNSRFTGAISGTTLTVSAPLSGDIVRVGQTLGSNSRVTGLSASGGNCTVTFNDTTTYPVGVVMTISGTSSTGATYNGPLTVSSSSSGSVTGACSGTGTQTAIAFNHQPGWITGPLTDGTIILNQLTGTTGGAGTYTVSNSQTVASETMTGYKVFEKSAAGYAGWQQPLGFFEASNFDGASNRLLSPDEFDIFQTGGIDSTGGTLLSCSTTSGSTAITCTTNLPASSNGMVVWGNWENNVNFGYDKLPDDSGVPAGTTLVSGQGTTSGVLSAPATLTNATNYLIFANPTYGQYPIFQAYRTGAIFLNSANGAHAITILRQSGNIGIGTNNPSAKLEINGTTQSDGNLIGSAGAAISGGAVNINNTSNFTINLGTGTNTQQITIGNATNTGKTVLAGISIGANADFLCLSSGGVVLLQTSACTISSLRFKEDVTPMAERALPMIKRMAVDSYRLKATIPANKDPNARSVQFGLIAENIAKIVPECAIYEPDMKTPKSYRQECVIALLVKGEQELVAQNAALVGRIQRLGGALHHRHNRSGAVK